MKFRKFISHYYFEHFYRTNHSEITTKLSISIDLSNMIFFLLYQRIEWLALIQEVGAYSRGRLFDNPVSRVSAYSSGRLFEGALNRVITL